jgi:hypothetical protein
MKSKKSAVHFSNAIDADLLHNKYVLYLSFFFAILTAAKYLFSFNLEAIIIFIVIGFLTTYFSKNMIVVLLTTTIGTNFIMMFKNKKNIPTYYNIMEGMESGSGATSAPPPPGVNPVAAPPAPATGAGPAASPMATSDMVKQLSQAMTAIGGTTGGVPGAPPMVPVTSSNNAQTPGTPDNAPKEVFSKKKRESMTQLTPASYDGSSGDAALSGIFQGMASGATNQKNQAYNTLNSLGGGANTNDLLGQQTEMINNLKTIEPILQTAEKFLDKFENSSISKMFQNMGGSIPGMSLLTGGSSNNSSNGLNPAAIGM